jgi:hypothetical protein
MEKLHEPITGMNENEVQVDDIQIEAAEAAHDIRSFQSGFHERMERMVGKARNAAEERAEVIDSFASDMGDLQLEKTEAGVLGYAYIGGGRGSVRLSKDQFAQMKTAEDVERMRQAGGHELGHAKAVHLEGELILDAQAQDDQEELQEGFAEKQGNAEVGMSIHEHREGQPDELYRSGQNTYAELESIAGESVVEEVFTKTGDLSVIQAKLDEAGRGRSREQLAKEASLNTLDA